jgi:hypothetical protein
MVMRKLLFVLLLLAAAVVGLGFYRGWFSSEMTKDPESGRQGIQIEVDQNKIKPDIEKAKEKLGVEGSQTKDKPDQQKP